jgi:hypothetical protein
LHGAACQYPVLPKPDEVQDAMAECDKALRGAHTDLISHIRSLSLANELQTPAQEHPPDTLGLVEFRGFLIPRPMLEAIVRSNRDRVSRSNARAVRDDVTEPTFYYRVGATVRQIEELLPYGYVSAFWRRQVVQEKLMSLTAQYLEIATIASLSIALICGTTTTRSTTLGARSSSTCRQGGCRCPRRSTASHPMSR